MVNVGVGYWVCFGYMGGGISHPKNPEYSYVFSTLTLVLYCIHEGKETNYLYVSLHPSAFLISRLTPGFIHCDVAVPHTIF
jgi:hypothetical protein